MPHNTALISPFPAAAEPAYHEFLNSAVCRSGPYDETFWEELKDRIAPVSRNAANYPKAHRYRGQLTPYLLCRVTLRAEKWTFVHAFLKKGMVQLCLLDVRLSRASGGSEKVSPDIYIDHMNVMVSVSWLNRVAPSYGYHEPLLVDGLLYEYDSSAKVRNIGVQPAAMVPCRWYDDFKAA